MIDYHTVLGPLWQQYRDAQPEYTATHIDDTRLKQVIADLAISVSTSLSSVEQTATASADRSARDNEVTVRIEIDELDAKTWLEAAKNDILLHQIFLKRLHEQMGHSDKGPVEEDAHLAATTQATASIPPASLPDRGGQSDTAFEVETREPDEPLLSDKE